MLKPMLYIFVEGDDDERFFERIIIPILEKRYSIITIVKYAQMQPKKRRNFINSITAMNADYIFVADINNSPCVTKKKETIREMICNIDENKIIVVTKEIESWYLGGMDSTFQEEYGLGDFLNTDDITKERFNKAIPPKIFESRIDFMVEILNRFSLDSAKRKNKSFRYFSKKYHF